MLRLALRLTAGLLSTTGFTLDRQPFGNGYEAQQWLRRQLAPLARRDRFIRDLMAVLDPENPPRRWASPRAAKRELLRLAARGAAYGEPINISCVKSRRLARLPGISHRNPGHL